MRRALLSGLVLAVLAGHGFFFSPSIVEAQTSTPESKKAEPTDAIAELEGLLKKLSEGLLERAGPQVQDSVIKVRDSELERRFKNISEELLGPVMKQPADLKCAGSRLWNGDTRSACYISPKICQGASAGCNQTATNWRDETEM